MGMRAVTRSKGVVLMNLIDNMIEYSVSGLLMLLPVALIMATIVRLT